MTTQAERIFAKFGGVPKLEAALKRAGRSRDKSAIYRWNLPVSSGGTGGTVPVAAVHDVLAAARLEGIYLSETDLWPGER